jgi:hypothetical protein
LLGTQKWKTAKIKKEDLSDDIFDIYNNNRNKLSSLAIFQNKPNLKNLVF